MPEHPDRAEHAPDGVIFDIGYRHFEGPRVGRRQIATALYLDSLRGAFGLGRSTRAKVMPFVLLTMAMVPTLIIAVIASVIGFADLPIGYLEYLNVITTFIVLFVAGQAPAAVSRDLRFRTVSLYFSRPLGRADYVRAKYAALATAVLVFTAAPLVTLYLGALLAPLPFWEQTEGLLVSLAAAVLVALVVSGVGLVIAAVTPRRGLGVAAVIGVLIITAGVQGALQVLGEETGRAGLAQYSGLVDPFSLVIGLVSWAFDTGAGPAPAPDSGAAALVYLGVLVVLVAGSYLALAVRYARVSVS